MGSRHLLKTNFAYITDKINRSRKIKIKEVLPYFIILQSFLLLSTANCHREHKVHNITLYPDKHSWCNVLPIKQVISHPGCKSVEIDNNVCVGACFSYSIPHTEPSDPGEVIVPYCDSCQPSEKNLRYINLECELNESGRITQQLKTVQHITNCTCTSCEKDKHLEQILRGNSAKEIKESQSDTPDLLDALQNRDENNVRLFHLTPERSKLLKNLMNSQIMTLLKNIQSENSQKDKEQLTEALKLINEQSKEKVSDSTIAALVNSFNRENIELDLPKLLETLKALENTRFFEKLHKLNNNEGSGFDNNQNYDDDDIKNDEENISPIEGSRVGTGHLKGAHIGMGFNHYSHHNHHNHHKRQHHELSHDKENSNEDYEDKSDEYSEHQHHNDIEVENIPNMINMNDNSLLNKLHNKKHPNHVHHKHHHVPTNVGHHDDTSSSTSSLNIGSSTDTSSNEIGTNKDDLIHKVHHPKHHHHVHHHHHGVHHHLGEHIAHGHLSQGPHGSLVIQPDHIEQLNSNHDVDIQHSNTHEQINVNPNDLKPNHAGTLLTYSSHPTSSNGS